MFFTGSLCRRSFPICFSSERTTPCAKAGIISLIAFATLALGIGYAQGKLKASFVIIIYTLIIALICLISRSSLCIKPSDRNDKNTHPPSPPKRLVKKEFTKVEGINPIGLFSCRDGAKIFKVQAITEEMNIDISHFPLATTTVGDLKKAIATRYDRDPKSFSLFFQDKDVSAMHPLLSLQYDGKVTEDSATLSEYITSTTTVSVFKLRWHPTN